MLFLFKDYTDLVLKAYEERRDANQLSQLLMYPTTANIKLECINVYNERFKRGEPVEENTLRAFFGILPEGKHFGNLIEKCSPDRFRPIQNLIRKETKSPASANVELLAWLIDFNPRPLSRAEKIFGSTDEIADADDQVPDTNQPPVLTKPVYLEAGKTLVPGIENPQKPSPKSQGKNLENKRLKIAAAISLMMAIFFGGMYIRKHQKSDEMAFGTSNAQCMYWAGDHYEPTPCNDKGKGFLFPLDKEKMKSFKKITRKDTITEWSIGKLYYIKNNNDIECYTEGGICPEYSSRKLKMLSRDMYDKYLRKGTPGKDSIAGKSKKVE